MKYKHENIIKNVSIFSFVLIMIFMKVSDVSAQMFVAGTLCICAILIGIYLVYKGLRAAGMIMFCLAAIGLLVALSQYFNSYNISVLIPAMFILFFIISYRMIDKIGDEEQIVKIKKTAIIGVILCSIVQIIMIIPIFIKK